jgi:hypothetical protein
MGEKMKEDYALYVKWLSILEYIMDISGKYPKNVRFTLCDRMVNYGLDALELIVEAIYAKNRADILRRVNLYMEKLRSLMQISQHKRYISVKQYEYISREINEAGSMVGGWLKTCKE